MARADLSGIDLVIVEILAVQRARLVADQPVFGDRGGIEFHLHLHIARNREKRARQLVHQHLLRLVQRVDIGRLPIAVLGKRLHRGIIEIAPPEAQNRQIRARVRASSQ